MKGDTLYTLKEENAKLRKAVTKLTYQVQLAQKHLSEVTPAEIAKEIGLGSRQSMQVRINAYKKEVAK